MVLGLGIVLGFGLELGFKLRVRIRLVKARVSCVVPCSA